MQGADTCVVFVPCVCEDGIGGRRTGKPFDACERTIGVAFEVGLRDEPHARKSPRF